MIQVVRNSSYGTDLANTVYFGKNFFKPTIVGAFGFTLEFIIKLYVFLAISERVDNTGDRCPNR